jgi:hypothetical protein
VDGFSCFFLWFASTKLGRVRSAPVVAQLTYDAWILLEVTASNEYRGFDKFSNYKRNVCRFTTERPLSFVARVFVRIRLHEGTFLRNQTVLNLELENLHLY